MLGFVIERSGSRGELLAQLDDIGRYPESKRVRFPLWLRLDQVSKTNAPRYKVGVLIYGVDFEEEGVCTLRGRFTQDFEGEDRLPWYADEPFAATLDVDHRKGKLWVRPPRFDSRYVDQLQVALMQSGVALDDILSGQTAQGLGTCILKIEKLLRGSEHLFEPKAVTVRH